MNVVTAHMEMATPSIAQGFAQCVQQGARRVVVVPFFLAPGRHATEDIPNMVREAAEQWKGVSWEIGDVLGADPKLVDVVIERSGMEKKDV